MAETVARIEIHIDDKLGVDNHHIVFSFESGGHFGSRVQRMLKDIQSDQKLMAAIDALEAAAGLFLKADQDEAQKNREAMRVEDEKFKEEVRKQEVERTKAQKELADRPVPVIDKKEAK